jgi:hypothetical protein
MPKIPGGTAFFTESDLEFFKGGTAIFLGHSIIPSKQGFGCPAQRLRQVEKHAFDEKGREFGGIDFLPRFDRQLLKTRDLPAKYGKILTTWRIVNTLLFYQE